MSDRPAEELHNSLVPQANTEQRYRRLKNDISAYTKIQVRARMTRSWRKDHSIVVFNFQFIVRNRIGHYINIPSSHLIQVLSNVLCKGVEIINQEYFHSSFPCLRI